MSHNHDPGIHGFVDACQSLYPEIRWITTSKFLEVRTEREWRIVDVRSDVERAVSIIPDSISISEFGQRITEYLGQPVLVYCTVGCRSASQTENLRDQGVDAYNLWGGVVDWAQQGGTFTTLSGAPTRRVHTHGRRWDLLPPKYIAVW